ncbi:hypothetical protein IE4872_PC00024 (plasmid) [Rhizobium gallicum]|uniref:Uncharacterized protein n=2 Tax=Rhizobium gallicum TaxID=56730 RepID=A0A0B4XA05_9HYPH|nr:hypothetical protein RGR602_PB00023 [Rhizobium gallicum bv. gallicum R602sp]APO70057.1 hypothetical protein IE4872_PC00024 [Rhizobium gallicum]
MSTAATVGLVMVERRRVAGPAVTNIQRGVCVRLIAGSVFSHQEVEGEAAHVSK